MGRTETLTHHWWERKVVQSCWKTAWQLLNKFNICLPHGPNILLVRYLSKKNESPHKDLYTYVYSTKSVRAPKQKPKLPSIVQRIKKLWYIHIMMEYSNKEELLAHTVRANIKITMLT